MGLTHARESGARKGYQKFAGVFCVWNLIKVQCKCLVPETFETQPTYQTTQLHQIFDAILWFDRSAVYQIFDARNLWMFLAPDSWVHCGVAEICCLCLTGQFFAVWLLAWYCCLSVCLWCRALWLNDISYEIGSKRVFCVLMYLLLCVLSCQYQCKWFLGKTRLWSDLLYVECDFTLRYITSLLSTYKIK